MEITPGSTNAALVNAGLTTGPSNAGSAQAGLSPLSTNITTTVSVATLPPELLRPQVIEAVVLRNTLLPAPNGNDIQRLQTALGFTATQPANPVPAPATQVIATNLPNLPLLQLGQAQANQTGNLTALFRIALQWQGKSFEVISEQPFPPNTPIQIQVTPRNELILRSAIGVGATANVAMNANTTPGATALSQQSQPTLQQRIQPLVRENLPRQQPLTVLLPALRALIAPELQTKMPATLARAILNLWQSVLSPKQLQQPAVLKQAVINSGSFFEANTAAARAASAANPQAIPQILGTDLKAQIMVLLTLLKSRTSSSSSGTNTTAPPEQIPVADDDAIYQKPMTREGAVPLAANKLELSADALLQQLSKALEAGLSRIHLNQLDTVISRHPSADPTQTVPTWVLELPMQTQRGQDQLAVRVEEHERKHDNKRYKQWLVQLGFDLHELGKLSATLSIVEHSVAATLWAEHAQTHRTVQREMTSLRKGLESVGVNVTEMQCRHGVPPERNGLLSQRLVDTHS